MKFNVNEQVTVVLTDYGEGILKKNEPGYYGCSSIYNQTTKELTLELWGIMNIFGGSMWNGNRHVPFKNNRLEIHTDQWFGPKWTFEAKIIKGDPTGKFKVGTVYSSLRGYFYKNPNSVVLVNDFETIEVPRDIVEINIDRTP